MLKLQNPLVKDKLEGAAAPAASHPTPTQAADLPLCIGEIHTECIGASPLTVTTPVRRLAVSHTGNYPSGTCRRAPGFSSRALLFPMLAMLFCIHA